jgi:hypothetical protein
LQSHIWLTASSYMVKYFRISSYMREPFLIYDFATDPIWISLYMRKISFSFFTSAPLCNDVVRWRSSSFRLATALIKFKMLSYHINSKVLSQLASYATDLSRFFTFLENSAKKIQTFVKDIAAVGWGSSTVLTMNNCGPVNFHKLLCTCQKSHHCKLIFTSPQGFFVSKTFFASHVHD